MIDFEELKGVIETDQTGRFPITSELGNAYIMVLYDFDSNAILATCIKSRNKEYLIEGFKEVHRELKDAVIVPQLIELDSEASSEMIKTIKKRTCRSNYLSAGLVFRP